MHRSGTSFLARALNLRGTYLGPAEELISDDFRSSSDNLRGHWESNVFLKLADQTLQKNGGSWHEIPEKVAIDDSLGKEIKDYSTHLLEHPSLASGFKDPRTIFCLDSWEKFLPADFILVGIYRYPLKVCESLKQRNGFAYNKSINLWKQYNEKLLLLLEKYPGFLLNFDWPKEKLFSELDFISEKLGLSKKISLDEWYTADLKKSDGIYNEAHTLNDSIMSTLSKLGNRSAKNSEVLIPSISRTAENLSEITDSLLKELGNQHNYFRKINVANMKTIEEHKKTIEDHKKTIEDHKKTIEDHKKTIEDHKKTIEAIRRSPTWKTLTKIDSVRKKLTSTKS
jgi:hypothetical protein